jgi:hypothetical protein
LWIEAASPVAPQTPYSSLLCLLQSLLEFWQFRFGATYGVSTPLLIG